MIFNQDTADFNSQRCNEDLANIEEALMQGQLLQEASACGISGQTSILYDEQR